MSGRRKSNPSFIYILQPVGRFGPFKIGCSAEPLKRLKTFMRWSPDPLEVVASIPGTSKLESAIHDCLLDSHSHSEWFRPTAKVRAFVDAVSRGVAVESALDLSSPEGCMRKQIGMGNRKPKGNAFRWTMRVYHAQRRAEREHFERYSPSKAAEAEIKTLRVADEGGALPDNFEPVELKKFVADPHLHGVSYTKEFGRRPSWLDHLPEPTPHHADALAPTAEATP